MRKSIVAHSLRVLWRTGLKRVLFNSGGPQEQVAGPVAVVAAGSQAARTNATALFHFAAIVSINLAVVNALPLPALDGGYMALLVRVVPPLLSSITNNTSPPPPPHQTLNPTPTPRSSPLNIRDLGQR